MKDLLQLFATRAEDESSGATEIDLGEQSIEDIRTGLRDMVRELLEDGGVNIDCVEIEVRDVGRAHDGRHVFLGMLRLAHWHRKSALRLMIGLPLVERLLRRLLRGSWLADVSHFGGLWLHPASGMVDADVMRELREIIQAVEHLEDSPSQPPRESMWSVPADMEQDTPLPTPPISSS